MGNYPPANREDEPLAPDEELPSPDEELPAPDEELPPAEDDTGMVSKGEVASTVEATLQRMSDVFNETFGEVTGQTFGVESGEEDLGPAELDDETMDLPLEPAPEEEEELELSEDKEDLDEEKEDLDEEKEDLDEVANNITKRVLDRIVNESKEQKKTLEESKKVESLDLDALSDKLVEQIFASLKK